MTLRTLAATLVLSLALPAATPAHAGEPVEGLAWQWNDKERQYHISTSLLLPEWVWLRALNNLEVRAMEVYYDMLLTCAPEREGKKRWWVKCKVDDFGLEAAPMPRDENLAKGDNNVVQRILDEWSERLIGKATLEISWNADGRIGVFKWVGLDRRNQRDLQNLEIFRQLFMRAFSAMQIRMPKKATDEGLGQFEEKNPLLSGYPAGIGGVGAVRAITTISPDEGSRVKFTTKAEGAIGHPSSAVPEITTGVVNTFGMTGTAEGIFDTAEGHLISREVEITGIASAGSAVAEGREALPYIQKYTLTLVEPGTEPPPVRKSQPIEPRR